MIEDISIQKNHQKKKDSVKSEHLKDTAGNFLARPIMYCIGSKIDFNKKLYPEIYKSEKVVNNFGLKNLQNIEWGVDLDKIKKNIIHPHDSTEWVMSEINTRNKFSLETFCCLNLVVAGTRKDGKNVSFLLHMAQPYREGEVEEFTEKLTLQLHTLQNLCKPNTIDAVIIGGDVEDSAAKKYYTESLKLLSERVKSNLSFQPVVLNGPKRYEDEIDNIYYDNENRRLYFIRQDFLVNQPKKDDKGQQKGQVDFMASELYKGKKFQNKWKR